MAKSISRYLADISSTTGVLDGILSTAAQSNITSLGTLSSLTVSGSAAMTLTTAAQPNITSVGTLSSLSTSGNISITGSNNELRLYEGANYVGFEAPALSADKIWVLPAADGSNGQVLTTNGSGTLSFAAVGGKSTEEIQDIIGAMFSSNTETGIAATYQDGDGTIDLVIGDDTIVSSMLDTNIAIAGTLDIAGAFVFNEAGADVDFRVEGNTFQNLIFANAGTDRVGIGTATPSALLDVQGAVSFASTLSVAGNQISTTNSNEWLAYNGGGSSPYLRMKTSGTNNGYIQFTTTASYIWNDRINGGFRLQTLAAPDYYDGAYRTMWHSGNAPISSTGGANQVLKSTSSGYLQLDNWIRAGNGTGFYTAQGAYLYPDTTYGWYIRNGASSTQSSVRGQASGGAATFWLYGETDYDQGFLTNTGSWSWKGDNSGNWTATANVTAYSDIRLKEKVNTIPNALEKVTKLRGVEYTRISTQEREIGVIAQEVKEIVPELVSTIDETSAASGEGLKDLHVMKYQNTVGLLIEAIKELKAEVDELKGNK